MNSNLVHNLSHIQQPQFSNSANLARITKGNPDFVRRLVNYKSLPVHNGCVNSISWNATGSCILSGSDDHKLIVTDPFRQNFQIIADYKTDHRSNIFCARFLPFTNDEKILSCSGDGVILVTDLQNTDSYINRYECHDSTCYKLLPLDSYTFLSCSEDKTVRFYDIRVKQSCCCRVLGTGNRRNTEQHQTKQIIKAPRPVSSIASHPFKPYEIALGVADSSVYIHDRRMLENSGENLGTSFVERLTVPSIMNKPYRVTSVNYSANGSELVASFSSDYVYLFQLANNGGIQKEPLKFQEPILSPVTPEEPPPTRQSSNKKLKKIRLRGDWSDTGPNARPSNEAGSSEIGQARPTLQNSLMERMTIVLSQMLSQSPDNSGGPSPALEQMGIENEQLNDTIESTSTPTGVDPAPGSSFSSNHNFSLEESTSVPLAEQMEMDESEANQPKNYRKFLGHRNTRTMIKEANFWGDQFIISGSDCGHIFFWNKWTGEIVNVLEGDKHVVNNVQPHPFYPILASSGIDYDIKLWTPSSTDSRYNHSEIQKLVRRNALMLEETKDTITVPATFMIRMLSCLNHIRHQNPGVNSTEANSTGATGNSNEAGTSSSQSPRSQDPTPQ
ncbi:unnamed protein product [Allacma fusca]|uniref:DDB1-and CUL4-associated factor 6 n=1 Tax=Allacma fusca TaxID=39272 RepID=A0A8J2P8J2_9HEXA|nr:unnamed protein product [Allacma fusca]